MEVFQKSKYRYTLDRLWNKNSWTYLESSTTQSQWFMNEKENFVELTIARTIDDTFSMVEWSSCMMRWVVRRALKSQSNQLLWYCCCFAQSMFILLFNLIASSLFLKKNKKERARTKCRFFPTQTFVAAILLTMRWQKIFCDSDTAHKVQRSWRSISTLHRPFWDDGYKSSLFLPRDELSRVDELWLVVR